VAQLSKLGGSSEGVAMGEELIDLRADRLHDVGHPVDSMQGLKKIVGRQRLHLFVQEGVVVEVVDGISEV